MVTRPRIDALIQYTLDGRLIEALQEFYHPHAVMQENCQTPRPNLAASIARQKDAQAMTATVHEVRAVSVLHDCDRVAIEWHAEWTMTNGARVRIEEIALQLWQGDKIVHERFFYDPNGMFGNVWSSEAAAAAELCSDSPQ